ncbi:Leucine-rich repeat-containing G-protein coupled receptor 4 [Holothuria leucospilota]|uniref:Leucine-rich repeat-containing G-protein coupled receptor 4 n=1 Tax=Holothuria leucospilota TaxID=206669 RepID=A0A9Q1BLX2_HOLLE|nr:Leucine-rich repeat-containing G-protein coupled receptor 4 [Holothuria leucospilota]
METLPSNLPPDYHSLYLDNNAFKILNKINFNLSSLPHLRELSIAKNNITYVQNGTLNRLTKVVSLDMRDNLLSSVPYGISRMNNLQILDLSGNLIKRIPPEIFHLHNRLQTLFFDQNLVDVTTIEPGTFSSLVKLRKLSLSLSMGLYYGSAWEDPSYGRFISIPSGFDDYSDVQDYMSARCVNASSWFDPVEGSLSLVSLSLSYCQIKCLSSESLNVWFSNLQILDLTNNLLETFEDDIFYSVVNLEELYLEGNRLRYIPDNLFSSLSSLRILNLKRNQLLYVSAQSLLPISGTLTYLDISANLMETWNATSSVEFNHLKELSIRRNFISDDVQLSFTSIPYLEILKLGANNIKQFPNVTHMKHLTTILLSDNLIRVIPEHALQGCKKLQILKLNGNRLRTVPKSAILKAKRLQVLETKNNPLACDCNIKWLSEGIETFPDVWYFQYEMIASSTCSSPAFLANQTLIDAFAEASTDMICNHIPDTKSMVLLVVIWLSVVAFIVVVKLYRLCPISRRHFHAIRFRDSLFEEDPALLNFFTKDKKVGKYKLVGESGTASKEVIEPLPSQSNQPVTPSKLRKVNWSKMPETQV